MSYLKELEYKKTKKTEKARGRRGRRTDGVGDHEKQSGHRLPPSTMKEQRGQHCLP